APTIAAAKIRSAAFSIANWYTGASADNFNRVKVHRTRIKRDAQHMGASLDAQPGQSLRSKVKPTGSGDYNASTIHAINTNAHTLPCELSGNRQNKVKRACFLDCDIVLQPLASSGITHCTTSTRIFRGLNVHKWVNRAHAGLRAFLLRSAFFRPNKGFGFENSRHGDP